MPSEINNVVDLVGLSPPLKFSPTEPVSKVVTISSSPHKIWYPVITVTTDVKVVPSNMLGCT